MSDTTEQECACCGFDTDCIDGLCQPCNDFNFKLEKLHKKVVVELQAENKRLRSVIHDVIILTEETSTKEFAKQVLKGQTND